MKKLQFTTDLAPHPNKPGYRYVMAEMSWPSHQERWSSQPSPNNSQASLFVPDQGSMERGRFLVSPVS